LPKTNSLFLGKMRSFSIRDFLKSIVLIEMEVIVIVIAWSDMNALRRIVLGQVPDRVDGKIRSFDHPVPFQQLIIAEFTIEQDFRTLVYALLPEHGSGSSSSSSAFNSAVSFDHGLRKHLLATFQITNLCGLISARKARNWKA